MRFAENPRQKVSELMTREKLITVRENAPKDEVLLLLSRIMRGAWAASNMIAGASNSGFPKFGERDAISYCLEAMQHKEDYIRRQYGELVLVQKSSSLVEGTPALEAESVYGMLLGKTGEEI